MKPTVYIASSWKNQHAVELLTDRLRERGWEVRSFIENNFGEPTEIADGKPKDMPFDVWVASERGEQSFRYDTTGAMHSDLVIYVGPSGCDAWAEIGAAFAAGRTILGLHAKGEQVGLMRRMVSEWHGNFRDLLVAVDGLQAMQRMPHFGEAEHPTGYDGECACQTCRSYG